MRKLSRTLTAALAFAGATLIPQVRAQNSADYYDPPERAARLSWVERNVSMQPGGVDDWVPANINRPLTTGDRLWTEAGARAEVHIGTAAFRLNGRTNFTFLNLTDGVAQVELSSGTLNVRVRNLASQEDIEIDTPQAAFSLLQPGDYRIEVNEQGDASVFTVRAGEAEALSGDQVFPMRARDQVVVTDDNRGPAFNRRTAPVADVFDNWCQQRDRREDMATSGRYVSRDIPGYADLDGQGDWTQDPEYSAVWMPRVTADWAPYRDGHWAWIEPWGWTWEDDAPWGYAPFHYGRWVSIRNRWGWVPGPVVARPVYSPALVAWVGGAGFSIGVSIGGPPVGWFPLGPREVWVPPYRYSPRYIERVNVTNTIIVNRTFNNINISNVNYVNRNVAGAVTAVPRDVIISGREVRSASVRVSPDAVSRGQVGAFAAVAPQRTAVLGGRSGGGAAPPSTVTNRRIVARATPPPPPVPFAQRQTALQANPGRPLDRTAVTQIQQSQPSRGRPEIRQVNPQRGAAQQGKGNSFGQQNGGQQDAGQNRDQQKGRGQQGGGLFQGQPGQPQAQPPPQQPAVIPQPPVVQQQEDRQRGRGQQGGRPQQAQPPVQQPQQPAVIPQPPIVQQQEDRQRGRGQQDGRPQQAQPPVQVPQQPQVIPQPPQNDRQNDRQRGRGQQQAPQSPQLPPQAQPQVQQPQPPAVIPQPPVDRQNDRQQNDRQNRGRGQGGQSQQGPQPVPQAPQAPPPPQPTRPPTPQPTAQPQAQPPAQPAPAPQPPADRQKGRGKQDRQDNKDKGKDN